MAGVAGGGETRQRLLDLGFVKGTAVKICNIAPFKATVLVSLRGYVLAVRRQTALLVLVDL